MAAPGGSRRGFVLTMEAFFSLLAALLLLSFIPLTYNANAFSRGSLYEFQRANDVAEVMWAAGDYARIGDWAEGNEAAGAVVRGRLGEISDGMGACVVLEVKGKMVEAGCSGKNTGDVVSITRTIVGKNGIYELGISVS